MDKFNKYEKKLLKIFDYLDLLVLKLYSLLGTWLLYIQKTMNNWPVRQPLTLLIASIMNNQPLTLLDFLYFYLVHLFFSFINSDMLQTTLFKDTTDPSRINRGLISINKMGLPNYCCWIPNYFFCFHFPLTLNLWMTLNRYEIEMGL